ncbi:DUF4362 domain-containing protein [Paenibacillus sp. FSL H7-0331]|uniref:DUF4362 domain-containing protein n=1 Tax=Paenibacillus sp. FSL H7-0331 TaxID=1920421 RepID=UPI00096DB480|nr:DUF4362 domain-containing protein [Paenibacillus sp. FSL H7-0331]OMF04419.1 hypothetical protein BK127_34045 [Paenibacillus sp. FSL H7-0331]
MKIYIFFPLIILLLTACNDSNSQVVYSHESDFPKVTKPYRAEKAIQNGDVVNVHGKFTNLDKWHQFMEGVTTNQAGKVRITQYTIEGDPIFYELTYNGKLIKYTFDNSMDAFGSDLKRPTTNCKAIEKKKSEQGQEGYVLNECENNQTGKTFWFVETQ